MNYANKDRRKTAEIKFGNLDYFIILLQYKQRGYRRESRERRTYQGGQVS